MTSHHRSLPWLHDITIELQQMPLCWMRRMKMIVGGLVQQLITVVLLTALKREGLGERPKGCRFLVHGLIYFCCALGGARRPPGTRPNLSRSSLMVVMRQLRCSAGLTAAPNVF
jgi:hypothetical protein